MANAGRRSALRGPADTMNAFMAIGDSITIGYPGNAGGWRAKLNVTAPKMVFQGRNDNNGLNEGYNGYRTDQVLPVVQPIIPILQPRCLLICMGVNDINQGESVSATLSEVISFAQTLAAMSTYVTHVFISELPLGPTMTADGAAAFNSGLAAAVAAIGDPRFYAAATCDTLITGSDFADGLHPTEGGYQKMADAWYSVLHAVFPVL